MMLIQSLLVAIAAVVAVSAQTTGGQTYQNNVLLDTSSNFQLFWTVDQTAGLLHVKVSVETQAWAGIGFHNDTQFPYMTDGDLYTGLFDDETGEFQTVSDRYFYSGPKHGGYPNNDTDQGCTYDVLTSGGVQEGNSSTVFWFTRKLQTGDHCDHSIENRLINVVWAYGGSNHFSVHQDAGSHQINLFTPSTTGSDATTGSGSTTGAVTGSSTTGSIIYDNKIALDNVTNFSFSWHIDSDSSVIYIQLLIQRTGWVAIGFHADTQDSEMAHSDIYTGEFANGTNQFVTVNDRYYNGTGAKDPEGGFPDLDTNQGGQYSVLPGAGGQQAAGWTSVWFARKLNTNDNEDNIIANKPVTIIWAYGTSNPFSKHCPTCKGSLQYNLFAGSSTTGSTGVATTGSVTGAGTTGIPVNPTTYDHTQVLDQKSGYTFSWTVDQNAGILYVQVEVAKLSWVGIGFQNSQNQEMSYADIYSATWTDSHQLASVDDRFFNSTSGGYPDYDTNQGCQNNVIASSIGGYQVDGNVQKSIAWFARKLNTGDACDLDLTNTNIHVLWAYGTTQEFHVHCAGCKSDVTINLYSGSSSGSTSTTTTTSTTTGGGGGNDNTKLDIAIAIGVIALVISIANVIAAAIISRKRAHHNYEPINIDS